MPVEMKVRPTTKVYELTNLKLDADGEGTFEAAFANLTEIDHDGDGYDPGSIGEQPVMVSQWNHGSWGEGVNALPIGVGKTFERDGWGMVGGKFDMSDPDAVKTYNKIKYLKENGFPIEWSFALPSSDWRMEEIDGQMVRIFTRISIPEVSPVLLGAGIDTHLTAIKQSPVGNLEDIAVLIRDELTKGETMETKDKSMEFAKQLDEAVVAVESVCGRAKQIQNLREEKGKDNMSRASTRRLKALRDALVETIADVDDLLTDPNDELKKLAKTFAGGSND